MVENKGPFSAADLPVIGDRIYHLDLRPQDLAKDIIIVGDPDRVTSMATEYLNSDYIERFHRGLRTITGFVKETGQRVSFVTSGMGTPSLEIVVQEIVALNEMIIESKTRRDNWDQINIIRVGTSGGLQPNRQLGDAIITEYAIGLDSTGLHYNAPVPDKRCLDLEEIAEKAIYDATPSDRRFRGRIHPYASKATPAVVEALSSAAEKMKAPYQRGITVSNDGFFANQGRHVSRINLTVPNIDAVFADLDSQIPNLRFENMEMESSFLLHFMGALGYNVGSICPAIANRRTDTFAKDYAKNISDATKIGLLALHQLRYS